MENQDYKRLKIGTLVLLFLVLLVSLYAYWPETYGNDTPSIEKVISAQEGIRSRVSVFRTEEVHDYRIVGFLDENHEAGVAFFKANEKGNYVFQALNGQSTRTGIQTSFLKFRDVSSQSAGMDVIASNLSHLAQVKRIIRDTEVSIVDITENPSLTLMEIPDSYRDAYHTKFIFYDANGNIIEQ